MLAVPVQRMHCSHRVVTCMYWERQAEQQQMAAAHVTDN